METKQENVIATDYADVMQKSYIDYAMSVIISRALPDVRDGLKPVQRRTLYDMYELGIRYDRPYRKCARIVGDTMGKYHPHGDSSIYEALVVMAQDFKKGKILVDGHGNFGSIEGDGAAAMRYTEARLEKLTQEVFLADLDKNVVDFMPNFDETEKEPQVLPVKIPNLLVNGADGIAVGMATSIPPASSRKRKATRNSSPSTPNSVPMHPSPRSVPTGSGSEISARSNPTSGVRNRLARKAQPKPMRRLLPTMPTSTERKQPDIRPKKSTNRDISDSING